MQNCRSTRWFAYNVIFMVSITFFQGITPQSVVAGIIRSNEGKYSHDREQDIEKLKTLLEKKIVQKKLLEYGIPPEFIREKINGMSNEDLHILASKINQLPEGGEPANYNAAFELMLIGAITVIVLIVWAIYSIAKELSRSNPPQIPQESTQN